MGVASARFRFFWFIVLNVTFNYIYILNVSFKIVKHFITKKGVFFNMFYERLKELASEKKKSFNDIEKELNYGKNTLYRYKVQNPTQERLIELAKYFDVSVDYLLGLNKNTSTENNDLTEEENDLVRAFRIESEDMSEEEQAQFNKSLKDMMKIAKDLLNDDSNWKK